MFQKLLFITFLVLTNSVFAQNKMSINAEFPDYTNESLMLLQGDDGGVFVVANSSTDKEGKLTFDWDGEPGFYRISGKDGFVDFRMSGHKLEFSLSGSFKGGDLRFPDGDENNQYQYYLSEFSILNESISELHDDLKNQNEKDNLYKDLFTDYKKVKREKRSLLKDLWGSHIDSWSARFALAQQELMSDVKLKGQKAEDYYLKHFFDFFAFSDSLLAGTPIYYEKIGKYLKVRDLEGLIEIGNFKKIKDVIGNLFWLTELDPDSQKYLANYLMNKYPEETYTEVYHIVTDAYRVLNTCEYVLNTRTIRNRISNYKQIKKGWQAPDIPLYHSLDGRIQSLSDVNSELTLVVVWSGSCRHSIEMLNEITDIYYTYKDSGLEVVAVSLDNNLNFWKEIISYNDFSWINACDTDGLNGTVASQFNIYVTPSLFLMDPSLKIVDVPQTVFQLEKQLIEIFK